MDDTIKYLIHADVTADGVVEQNDVVGAIFGQTEGLLGDELDLRDLQHSSKVGRIDVDVESKQGQSFGHVTIETSLDKVETATLAAALETITRIGPCRSTVRVAEIEDVRAAKRREIVDRATELLVEGFSDSVMSSEEILREVRERVRVEDITEYEGLPAGPRVADADAVVVVEGRADVLQLLQFGIKNAVAVEGTNVPDAVADLTRERTTTVFLDGDRGGDLILEELNQVGEIDYVAFAPSGQSVEDLDRGQVFEALQEKVPHDAVAGMSSPRQAVAATDGSATPAPGEGSGRGGDTGGGDAGPDSTAETDRPRIRDVEEAKRPDVDDDGDGGGTDADDGGTDADDGADGHGARSAGTGADAGPAPAGPDAVPDSDDGGDGSGDATGDDRTGSGDGDGATAVPESRAGSDVSGADAADAGPEDAAAAATDDTPDGADVDGSADEGDADGPDDGAAESESEPEPEPETLRDHVGAVIDGGTDRVRLLDDSFEAVGEADAADAFEAVAEAESVPSAVVLDGELTQRILDVAAQRGVGQVVARSFGEFTKRPTGVRIRTAEQLATS